jgi:hypothetical protein
MKTLKDKKEVITAIDSMNEEFVVIESKMIQLLITGTGQDEVRFPTMLVERIAYLASVIAIADFPPTDQHMEVHKILQGRLVTYGSELDNLIEGKLNDFIKVLKDENINVIISD